jgi:putative Holliday junction resolvase
MSQSKRLLGIDFGNKRIGIAVSDPLNIIARGVKTIFHSPEMFSEIKLIAEEYQVDKIVVGCPLNLKGEKGAKALEVDDFIRDLKKVVGIEVESWDERFTSRTAHQTLLDMGVRRKQRQSKGKIDEMAASLILQSYLDCHKT